jgi:outer membrane receptor protein involved in Fe transport
MAGIVRDQATKHPVPFATISVVELKKGSLADSKGEFLLTGIPPGTYTVRCQFLGYKDVTREGVVVAPGQAVSLEFSIQEEVVVEEKEIVVTGERALVDVNVGTTIRSVDAREIESLPVQNLMDILEQQTGISTESGQIHIRGGRTDETLFIVDGVANRNLLTGESAAGRVSARSVAEVNVITGGFDAKYGQALSGIVDVKLKEGTQELHGGFTVEGGSYGTRLFSTQLSGPAWLLGKLPGSATFLVDLSADFTDTYLPNVQSGSQKLYLQSGYEDSFLGRTFAWGNFWMPSQENQWRGIFKTTWRSSPNDRFDFELTKTMGFDQGFQRRRFEDISGYDVAYPYAWSQRLDHYGTITIDSNQQLLSWTHLPNTISFFKIQLSRYFNGYNRAVNGKSWTEYEQPQDSSLPPGQDQIYFWDTGDDNRWVDTYSEVWSLGGDYTRHFGTHHRAEAGIRNDWQDVQYITIQDPWDFDVDNLGSSHDLWHVYPAVGNLYAQDQINYEGFVANLGLRLDYWFPGEQLEDAVADTSNKNISDAVREGFYEDTGEIFGHRVKAHLSPRVQVSHPITQRDNFFFNYGQFTQFPPYYYVYSKLTSVSSETFPVLGNANLNPEISVQYEVGGRHTFRQDLAGNLTLFWKDIYDYPTSVTFQRTQGDELVDVFVYINQDYARSRGFELELEKRRTMYWRYRLGFEYSIASGKSADPNAAKVVQEQGGDAAETPLGEEYMFWNRPYRARATVEYRVDPDAPAPKLFGLTLPRDWGISVYAEGQSGRAYTPQVEEGESVAKPYSENAPFQVLVDLKLNKAFRVGSQRFNFTLTGTNIFDTLVPRRIDPITGHGYEEGKGLFSPEEMAKLGSDEAREYQRRSLLENPSSYLSGSAWRLGFEYDF